MRLAEPLVCLGIMCLSASPAAAQEVAFNIPSGRLGNALVMLGQQAGITIAASDPAVAKVRSRSIRGRMTVRQALTRLLAGTGYQFIFVGADAVRISRVVSDPPAPPRTARPEPASSPPQPPPESEIIVTASKHEVPLEHFAGTAHIVDMRAEDVGRFGARGSEMILSRLPVLASTNLGPGRNKIFIRGVADSSFNGPSQALAGQYLGDVRLTFNAPDPDLQLYDVRRVEVLEGPQGTLYGTGALGGVLRLIPNAPDPSQTTASLAGGVLATQHGDPGGDLSATINLPLAGEHLTLRAVAYDVEEGGYIDDVGRGLTDVNRVGVHGGRAILLWTPGGGWQVELGATAQFISVHDSQYAERDLPPLSRRSSLAQPFDNDYRLAALTVRKLGSPVEFLSSTSIVGHDLDTRFDATPLTPGAAPQLFTEDVGITLLANETRLSRSAADGAGWVLGFSVLHNVGNVRRSLGPPEAMQSIAGVRTETTEGALFGQASFALGGGVAGTLGGRLTFSRSVGQALDAPDEVDEPTRSDVQASPTAALSWRVSDDTLLYVHYEQGFRAGGLGVSESGSAMSVERFESDSLSSLEAGIRIGRPGTDPWSLNAVLSFARWSDIQADLIDERGLPFTTNLGDGYIAGFEIEGSWQATPRLRLDVAVFGNESALTDPDPAFAAADETDLPNVAAAGGRLAAHHSTALTDRIDLSIDASIRYVGTSQLGIGPPLDVEQGDYVDSQVGARLAFGAFGLSLDVDNVLDTRGNTFAYGNPFRISVGNQVTPLRPRTVRVGLDASF